MNQLAHMPNVAQQIVLEYHTKLAAIDDVIENYKRTIQETNAAFRVMGEVTTLALADDSYISRSQTGHSLLSRTLQEIYKALHIARVLRANDKTQVDQILAKPPELTLDNLKSEFRKYCENAS